MSKHSELGLTDHEYELIVAGLGREPGDVELAMLSLMWSEHCSYKSSRVHLKRLPTKGVRTTGPGSVVQGPGENAGIIMWAMDGLVRSRLSRIIIRATSSLIRARPRVLVEF